MSKLTLLEATQDILSALDFDPVDDIDETIESQQVAQELRTSYFTLMGEREWPHLKETDQLEGVASTTYPTKMRLPADVNKVYWVRYNNKEVKYMDPTSFQAMIDGRLDYEYANDQGYLTNKDPEYWTTFDDDYLWFDSYDSDTETTLHEANSLIYVCKDPAWSHVSSFTPDMPQKMFYGWLADAKNSCFILYKQTANINEEKRAKRFRNTMQNQSWRNEQGEARFNRRINFGRK
jgi:hypothetical protein